MRIERELSTNTGEKVILYIEAPKKSDREHEFSCKLGLEGAELDKSTIIYGIDPMQAMLLSIRHLNGLVARASESIRPRRLIWEFGEKEDDFGLLI
jgi:hypothetical protein